MTVPFREVTVTFGDMVLSAVNRESDWVVEDLSGWFGGVGVKSDRTARLGHGDFSAPNLRTGRSMTLTLVWVGDSVTRDYASRALSGIFGEGDVGEVTARVGDLTLTASEVTLDGEIEVAEVGTLAVRAQVPLHAADPRLYAPIQESYLRPVGAGVGLEYALFASGVLSYGTAIRQDVAVTNNGSVTAYPTFWVGGDLPGGFRITANGKTVEWPWPVVASAPVRVESSGSIWIGDTNVTARATIRQWMPIVSGATIAPRFHALQGGDGWCRVMHQDAYI